MEQTMEMAKLLRQLEDKIKEQEIRGIKYAEAEKNYKVALSKEALRMKVEMDYPVTLIDKIVHGCEAVSELRYKRDVSKNTYDNTVEEINCLKTRIRVLEAQIKQDYAITRYQ